MRILYAAIDQTVPGTNGGSTHVEGVARALAALGHDVHVAVPRGIGPFDAGRVTWHDLGAPLGRPHFRLLRAGAVRRLVERVRPDVVMERYHNFGGEGLLAARRTGLTTVLEVNAPVVDYRGSPKHVVDRALFEPMRRWRDWQCRAADLIVTPVPDILPTWVDRSRVLEAEWGADTSRFRPGASGPVPFHRNEAMPVAIFAGAFRAWHGAVTFVEALAALEARGRGWQGVLIGDGPEMERVRARARQLAVHHLTIAGALPHTDMPAALAAADVGVAPFDVDRHAPLREQFFWSPLKVFEYLASGLPVVAPDLPRLRLLLGAGEAGVLYDSSAPAGLADALDSLADPEARRLLSARARSRAERLYSWDAHCRLLTGAIERARAGRANPGKEGGASAPPRGTV
jgi:glycosyltransferase involved in cell wall biosynthesis